MRHGRYLVLALSLVGIAAWVQAQPRSAKSLSAQDYFEIQQLYARYNHAIDSGDAEGWAGTFTPDGTFNKVAGHDALVGFVRTWVEKMNGGARRHWNTNLLITPTPDGAKGAVYLFLLDISAKPPAIAAAAHYDDVLVRTAQGWRFKSRATTGDTAPAKPTTNQ
jgi:uncharacterized protein (TIGR02246 family)